MAIKCRRHTLRVCEWVWYTYIEQYYNEHELARNFLYQFCSFARLSLPPPLSLSSRSPFGFSLTYTSDPSQCFLSSNSDNNCRFHTWMGRNQQHTIQHWLVLLLARCTARQALLRPPIRFSFASHVRKPTALHSFVRCAVCLRCCTKRSDRRQLWKFPFIEKHQFEQRQYEWNCIDRWKRCLYSEILTLDVSLKWVGTFECVSMSVCVCVRYATFEITIMLPFRFYIDCCLG